MAPQHIDVTIADGVARILLNRPERRNALSLALLRELVSALNDAGENGAVRVVVIVGAGPAFSAGHDLAEMIDRPAEFYEELFAECTAVMSAIQAIPQPVVAQVHGMATAAGCQLVAACDLAIAADDCRFATPGVSIGLFCSTPMVALSRNVAGKHAMEMLLTGDMTPAGRAAEIGLVNRSVPAEDLQAATLEMARKIASKSSMTLATGKRAFYAQREMTLSEAYDYASAVMVDNMLAADAEEGIGAFIEKRAPHWQDV